MKMPTDEGKLRWPGADGYLKIHPDSSDKSDRLACTCSAGCEKPDCNGHCGCGACALARLVYEDDRSLWDESGNLIAPEEAEGPWRRIQDVEQLRFRFSFGGWKPRTSNQGEIRRPTDEEATSQNSVGCDQVRR
jgi:hypothetical protein